MSERTGRDVIADFFEGADEPYNLADGLIMALFREGFAVSPDEESYIVDTAQVVEAAREWLAAGGLYSVRLAQAVKAYNEANP